MIFKLIVSKFQVPVFILDHLAHIIDVFLKGSIKSFLFDKFANC